MICPICETEVSPNETMCRACGAPIAPEQKGKVSYSLPVGAVLLDGQFTIGRVLGKGGFGVTYLGSDTHLRRSVAIKELFPSGCVRRGEAMEPGPGWPVQKLEIAKDKFLNEARVLAQFQHPNIVHVYTSFEQNNTAYMVMEYVRARTVQHLIREFGVIPEPEAIDYTVQLTDALKLIHGSSFLHRDIKPGNLLVADDGRVTLIDFGTAREYAADFTKQMTTMLTPGYAPLEQYTRSGKMGPFSDIYSMAATLYHMLTGQQPIAATDQANGAILAPPRQLNENVSEIVSEAVMWSMQMEAEQRPQTVDEFLGALSGRIAGPTSRRRVFRSIGSGIRDDNPYKQRIEQILDELAAGIPPAPRGDFDDRIDEITEALTAIGSATLPAFPVCPSCAKSSMRELKGDGQTRNCPICRKAELTIRDTDLTRCPICREGAMVRRQLETGALFCPVCHKQPMQIERRKRFGFALAEMWVCANCQCELRVMMGGRAKIEKASRDPFGAAKAHSDEALTLTEWRQISTRRDQYYVCNACQAQLDVAPDKAGLKMGWFERDPYGVGQKVARQIMPKHAWVNLSQGLPARSPNAVCPNCRSEFEINKDAQEIKPLAVNAREHAWSQRLLNKPIPFRNWYLADAGKRSPNFGFLCQSCRTEFDVAEKLLKLIWSGPGPLAGREGESHSREGWHRIAAGMPTRTEEQAMRDELTRLHIKKQEQQEHYYKEEAKYQAQLKEELDGLIHDAFIAGFVPVLPKETSIFMLEGETLYWESPAKRHQRTSVSGDRAWTFEISGVLMFTNQRIVFAAKTETWQHSLDEISRIQIEDEFQGRIVAVYVSGISSAVGFEIGPSEFTVTTEYSNHTLRGNAKDFVALTHAVRRRELGEEANS